MTLTFDDGILTVYGVTNAADPGDMPIEKLVEKVRSYYGYDQLGITRYYTALEANQQIEAVVNIPGWQAVQVTDIVILDEMPAVRYRVAMAQPQTDEYGLRIMKLSLERMDQDYGIPTESKTGAADSE